MNLPPVYAPLDPKVAPLVEALRRDLFPTSHSCDGEKEGGAIAVPWVNVDCARYGAVGTVTLTRAWLIERNIFANVCLVYGTAESDDYPFVRIEVYSDLAEARL